jgi:membrane protease YdiL (CAAX protease family)
MKDEKPLIKYGWLRALIYFIGILLLIAAASYIAPLLIEQIGVEPERKAEEDPATFALFYGLMGAIIFLFTFLIQTLVNRKSFKSVGFEWEGFSDEAGLGFFAAGALLGVGSLILVGFGYITFFSISINTTPLLLQSVIMIMVAFVEEVIFRGYLLNNLMQSMNKWMALIISALIFALVHKTNPDVTILALINIFLGGIFFGLNYIFTKNLWFSIFFHFGWNFLQGPILGYEVSGLKLQSLIQQSLTGPELWTGGPFGFEGSLLCPLLLSLSIIGLAYGFSKKYQVIDSINKS